MKTYSAESGYVYQYVYEGRRPLAESVEYVFSASADRTRFFDVSIVVPDESVEQWNAAHGRELCDAERYGIAKMALRQAFDQRDNPDEMKKQVRVEPPELETLAESLGLE
ncbi:MAG TPA: hypothetical protein VN428_22595 [Bryobacteraceae bacterium]|nr:hypothetical protein [Bryobacteraceae bacterium]